MFLVNRVYEARARVRETDDRQRAPVCSFRRRKTSRGVRAYLYIPLLTVPCVCVCVQAREYRPAFGRG